MLLLNAALSTWGSMPGMQPKDERMWPSVPDIGDIKSADMHTLPPPACDGAAVVVATYRDEPPLCEDDECLWWCWAAPYDGSCMCTSKLYACDVCVSCDLLPGETLALLPLECSITDPRPESVMAASVLVTELVECAGEMKPGDEVILPMCVPDDGSVRLCWVAGAAGIVASHIAVLDVETLVSDPSLLACPPPAAPAA